MVDDGPVGVYTLRRFEGSGCGDWKQRCISRAISEKSLGSAAPFVKLSTIILTVSLDLFFQEGVAVWKL